MKLSLIAAIVLSLLMAFFAIQNAQPTHITFLAWFFDGPLVIVLLLTFAAGCLSALLTMIPGTLMKSVEISKLKSRLAEADRKIESLGKQSAVTAQNSEQKTVNDKNISAP